MRRMTRGRRRPLGERGAVAIVTAVVVMVVALAALAMSIDVGRMTWERSQTQNAADASVMALARLCAKDPSQCTDANAATVAGSPTLLGGNSFEDSLGQLSDQPYPSGICGRNTALSQPCDKNPGSWTKLQQCPPVPNWLNTGLGMNVPYVETYAKTKSNDGDVLRSIFGAQSTTQITCARAAWGPLGSSRPSLPLVVGACNWSIATEGGTKFMSSPPYMPGASPTTAVPSILTKPQSPSESAILLTPDQFITTIFGPVNGSEVDVLKAKFPDCPTADLSAGSPSGQYNPGGFGWLTTCGQLGSTEPLCAGQNDCFAPIPGSGIVGGQPGGSLPTPYCSNELANFVGQEVDVPVVSFVQNNGSNLEYTVDGIATFYLAGYHSISAAHPSDKDAYKPDVPAYAEKACMYLNPSGVYKFYKSACMWGWFTSPLRQVGTIDPSVHDRGTDVVQPAG